MDEFAVLNGSLPLEQNLSKYMCIRTTINTFEDTEFRLASNLEKTIHKFSPLRYTEMKPLIAGIKCTLRSAGDATVWVRHEDRGHTKMEYIDTFDVENNKWYTFKYPLLANYHTETYVVLSNNVASFTIAILDTAWRVREDAGVNYFPSGYASFDTSIYGSFNKALVYAVVDEKAQPKYINLSGAALESAVIVQPIRT
jgi:hypothetical protein